MAEIEILDMLKATPRAKTSIFALRPPGTSQKMLMQLASRFEANGKGRLTQDGTKLVYTDGPNVFTLYRPSGAFRYQDQHRWQRDDGKANVKMEDAQAVKLAQAYVKEHGLAPLNELKTLKVTRLNVGSMGTEGKADQRVIDVGVAFQRTLQGVPVDGPGGKVIVYLDAEGKATGVDRTWRPVAGVAKPVEGLIPPKEVIARLERYWGREPGHVQVTGMRFGYFELGPNDAQRLLQPAYVVLLRLVSPEQRTSMNTAFVTPAATNGVGTLMPPVKNPVLQPPRNGR